MYDTFGYVSLCRKRNFCFAILIFFVLQIAVLAKHHGVPFYIAAPLTSIDLDTPNGDRIVIEERPAMEMTHVGGVQIAATGIVI